MKKLLASLIVLSIFAAVLFAGDFAEYKLSNGIPVYAKKNTVNHIDSVCVVVKVCLR